jgi:uncharacterized protein YdiU (UPF0061 family)
VQMEKIWTAKLGLDTFHAGLFSELEALMVQTPVDYTIFFRELSMLPDDIEPLKKSFYKNLTSTFASMRSKVGTDPEGIDKRWSEWLVKWKSLITSSSGSTIEVNTIQPRSREELSRQMKLVNPKYTMREWFVVPAYQQAAEENYSLVRELQAVMTQPYTEQSEDMEGKYYRLKPVEFFEVAGLSYVSCSS